MLCARRIDFFLCQRTWFAAILLWLNGAPSLHIGGHQTLLACGASKAGTAGRTLDDCMETTSLSWHSLGSFLRWGLTFNWKKHSPEQKQNQTHARVVREESVPGREGILTHAGPAQGSWGGAGVGFDWNMARWPPARGSTQFLPKAYE